MGEARRQIDGDGCFADAPFLIQNADDHPDAFLLEETAPRMAIVCCTAAMSHNGTIRARPEWRLLPDKSR
jgi:hypothetical protein